MGIETMEQHHQEQEANEEVDGSRGQREERASQLGDKTREAEPKAAEGRRDSTEAKGPKTERIKI